MQAYHVRFELGGVLAQAVVVTPDASTRDLDHALRARLTSTFMAHFFPTRSPRVLIVGVSALGPVAVHPEDREALARLLLDDPHVHPAEPSSLVAHPAESSPCATKPPAA